MAIHLLDAHVAELIAAGEVVERPASVIKELVENAIDAGATTVSVEIERGGIALMRVADNGSGIAAEDIPLAFVRHATSKVRTQQDLEAIATLGFRGEALASVASVAKVELLTKHAADDFASLFRAQGGPNGKIEAAARPQGTSITVRDLFYNTPARMKFLKKDSSEANYVTETMVRLALSHPQVAFHYTREGKQVFATPGSGDVKSAAWAALGAGFARDLISVEGAGGAGRISGLITPPRLCRASRSMQFFFINGRFVKNRTMMAALEQAYRGTALHGKFPGGILFLEMPPALVDVNVHPAKTEVRFARESDVFDITYRAVKATLLADEGNHTPLVLRKEAGEQNTAAAPPEQKPPAETPAKASPAWPARPATGTMAAYNRMVREVAGMPGGLEDRVGVVPYETRRSPQPDVDAAIPQPGPAATAAADPQQTSFAGLGEETAAPLRPVGEVFKTYLVVEVGDKLCLIDKHAAHERMLYEKLAAQSGPAAAQQLLAPLSVNLGAEEKNALLQSGEQLARLGMAVEDFGGGTVLVRSVPADIEPDDVEDLLLELAQRLALNANDGSSEKREWVLHSMACRAAVKAGDKTPDAQLLALAQAIMAGQVPPFCPHGRPVVLEITRKELEKQFGRLG
ncbi:MAG: DNA mismatch repair endonuclease MutL [Oscillospiraceae bacterium]